MFGGKSIPAMHLQHSEVTFTASRYKLRFSATLGEEPEIELACVMVPKKTPIFGSERARWSGGGLRGFSPPPSWRSEPS